MKIKFLSILSIALIAMTSCGGPSAEKVEAKDAAEVKESTGASYTINTDESSVAWVGTKLAYAHNGTIKISEGALSTENGVITSGKFVIDMSSIVCLDLEDEEKNAQLVGHLMSDDFFSVEAHPTASIEITDATAESITANLTIKGETKSITFPAMVKFGDGAMKAHAEFTIDRTNWGVQFGSSSVFTDIVADKAIGDDIEFKVHLVATENAM